jgi:hypothetical protein
MAAKFKWELHIQGDDLCEETTALIEMLGLLRSHGLPAPTNFTTTHMDIAQLAMQTAALPVEPVIMPSPEPEPEPEPAKRTRKPRAAVAVDFVPEVLLDDPVAEASEAPPVKVNGALAEFAHLTEAEALEKALVLLRLTYAAPDGGAEAVKALQKTMKIAKFSDVPDAEAHALLAMAVKLATQFGLVSP